MWFAFFEFLETSLGVLTVKNVFRRFEKGLEKLVKHFFQIFDQKNILFWKMNHIWTSKQQILDAYEKSDL